MLSTNCGTLDQGCFLGGLNSSDSSINEVVFFATAAGTYSVTVEIDSSIVKGSPFFLTVLPGVLSVSDSTMQGAGCRGGLVSYYASCTIISRDHLGNQLTIGGATWVVTLTYDDGTSKDIIPLDSNDGSYSLVYNVIMASQRAALSIKGPVDSMFLDISQSPAAVVFVQDDE